MKYALVNGERQEPQPKLSGSCPNCDRPMLARCGKIKIWHWAHRGKLMCDPWWENETEWHRAWKNQFPKEWHEVIHRSESGEKHIADVKTEQGLVIEFQHSPISPEERQSRNAFYKKIVWVVDGTRRKTDLTKFLETISETQSIHTTSDLRKIQVSNNVLLKEWAGSGVPVFFDFARTNQQEEKFLWCLLPVNDGSLGYVLRFPRADFIKLINGTMSISGYNFEGLLERFIQIVHEYKAILQQRAIQQQQAMQLQMLRSLRPRGVPQYSPQRRWKKAKRRF